MAFHEAETEAEAEAREVMFLSLLMSAKTPEAIHAFLESPPYEYSDVDKWAIVSSFNSAVFGSLAAKDLQPFGVERRDLVSCWQGNIASIRKVSLQLSGLLIAEEKLKRSGETHLVARGLTPSRSAIQCFALAAEESLQRNGPTSNPPELHFLKIQLLFPGESKYRKAGASLVHRTNAISRAAVILSETGVSPSYEEIAKGMKLSKSTISRLFDSPDEWVREVSIRKDLFEKHGRLVPADDFD